MRVGVIVNPRSHRNRHSIGALRQAVQAYPDVWYVELDHFRDLGGVLRDFSERRIELVAVSGGDGTVQAVMTHLINDSEFVNMPMMAVLPAGMTNVIAANVGMRGKPVKSLRRLLAAACTDGSAGERLERPVLSVRRTPAEQPVHGMFLGCAAFYRTVMMTRSRVHTLGAQQGFAAFAGLAMALLRVFLGRVDAHGVFGGERIRLSFDGEAPREDTYILLLATTLDRLILRLMPFWGEGEGAVRHTTITFPPYRPLRAFWPVVTGKPSSWMESHGYRSGRGTGFSFTQSSPYVLDGEIFQPDPGVPVTVGSDRRMVFWRLR